MSELLRNFGLEEQGIHNVSNVYWNLPAAILLEQIISRHEGLVAHLGPVVVRTGTHTGRSPNDKFIVEEPDSKDEIWWGQVNRPFPEAAFERLYQRQLAYLQDKDLFVQDCYVGADPELTGSSSASAPNRPGKASSLAIMFIREFDPEKLKDFQPDFTILCTPRFHAVPEIDGTRSDAFIIVNFKRRLVIIGGTNYAGEIKKSGFTIMNFLLPHRQVLSMHCSANYGKGKDDVALFFGLSGTGKTTLSTSERSYL